MVDTLTPSPREREAGWAEAFAALPLEAPPRDGWRQLERTLDAGAPRGLSARRKRRTNWTIGFATAAVLAVVAWSPLLRRAQAPASQDAGAAGRTIAANTIEPGAGERGDADAPGTRVPVNRERNAGLGQPQVAVTNPVSAAAQPGTSDMRAATADPHRAAAVAAATPSQPSVADPTSETRVVADVVRDTAASTTDIGIADATPASGASPGAAMPSSDADAIRALQAQSAQLEALVALARDDSAGSAGLALAGSELDASIAAIDASLAEPDLSTEQRRTLWQQRIDALQQLAHVETTGRWLASQGALYDTALVSID